MSITDNVDQLQGGQLAGTEKTGVVANVARILRNMHYAKTQKNDCVCMHACHSACACLGEAKPSS